MSHFKTSKILHEFIKQGNLAEVENILTNHKSENFYNKKNESAAAIAIKCQKLEIYELLL